MTFREVLKERPNLHTISCEVTAFACSHPIALTVGVGLFLLMAGCLVFWYEVFSGFAEPVQFIYAAF